MTDIIERLKSVANETNDGKSCDALCEAIADIRRLRGIVTQFMKVAVDVPLTDYPDLKLNDPR